MAQAATARAYGDEYVEGSLNKSWLPRLPGANKVWTPEKDTAIKATMRSKYSSVCDQIMNYVKLHSWGRSSGNRDFATFTEDGRRLTISSLAAELGISKQRCSEAVEWLASENRLHLTKRGFYLVADPEESNYYYEDYLKKKAERDPVHNDPGFREYYETIFTPENPEKVAIIAAKREAEAIAHKETREAELAPLVGYRDYLKTLQAARKAGVSSGRPEREPEPEPKAYGAGAGAGDSQPEPVENVRYTYPPSLQVIENNSDVDLLATLSQGLESKEIAKVEDVELPHTFTIPSKATEPKPEELAVRETLAEAGYPVSTSDDLPLKFVALALFYRLPISSLRLAIADKVRTKEASGSLIHSPGALLKFVREDLPTWIAKNGREIERARERVAERPPLAAAEYDPEELARWRADYEAVLADPKACEREKEIARSGLESLSIE